MRRWQEKPFIRMIFAPNAKRRGIKAFPRDIMTAKNMKNKKQSANIAEKSIKG